MLADSLLNVGSKPYIVLFSSFRLKDVDIKHGMEVVRPG